MHAIHNKLRDSDRDTVRCSGEAHRGKYTQKSIKPSTKVNNQNEKRGHN